MKFFIFSPPLKKNTVLISCCNVFDETDMVIYIELNQANVLALKKIWLTGLKLHCPLILTSLDRGFDAMWSDNHVCFKMCVGGLTKFFVIMSKLLSTNYPTGNAECYNDYKSFVDTAS